MDHFLFKRVYCSGYFDFFNFMARVTIQPKRHEISARCPKMTNLIFFWNFSLNFFFEIVFLKFFFEILKISRKNFKKKIKKIFFEIFKFQKKWFFQIIEIFQISKKVIKSCLFSNHRNFQNFKKNVFLKFGTNNQNCNPARGCPIKNIPPNCNF